MSYRLPRISVYIRLAAYYGHKLARTLGFGHTALRGDYALQRKIAEGYMAEWLSMLLRELPPDFEIPDNETRESLFEAFLYGCAPVHVAAALQIRKDPIAYCLRIDGGIV